MNTELSVKLCNVKFKNPVIAASGTFAFGREFENYFDLSLLGGIALKALTIEERKGNPPPRIAETASGILNSVGLQNPGVRAFKAELLPVITTYDTVKIANVAGTCEEDYIAVIEALNDCALDFFELNISCPNVKQGGVQFGTDEKLAFTITKRAKATAKKPLIVKLTPNTANIAGVARAVEDAGADAVSLINTVTGMAIDAKKRMPVLSNITGGLSGPAIKPIALRMVYEVYKAVQIPVIGMGGILKGEDAAEFMIAGASAVMVGTANILDPFACVRIIEELKDFAQRENIRNIKELTGSLKVRV